MLKTALKTKTVISLILLAAWGCKTIGPEIEKQIKEHKEKKEAKSHA